MKVMATIGLLCGVAIAVAAGVDNHAQPPQPERLMAVTVDDLPVAQTSWHTDEQMDRITTDLLATLVKHGVPAVGFVNEGKLETNGELNVFRLGLLARWLEAGFELGNHGYAHLDLHKVPPEEWKADVVLGETQTRQLVEASGGQLRFFRHPFLHTGLSVEVQTDTYDFLTSRGYTVAPVTIDNSEWIYGRAYARPFNNGDEELQQRIGRDYIRYMLEVVDYYEGQSEAIVGRVFPQVLLVHAYALNADWLDELLTELERRGYGWVSLESALEDPVYQRPIDGWTGMGGITWLHRWAITEGVDRSVFEDEPEPSDWVAAIRP